MRGTRVAVVMLAVAVACSLAAGAEDNGRTEHLTLGPVEYWAAPTIDCGDFWVLNDWLETYALAIRYDKEGNPVQWILHASVGASVYYNEFRPDIKIAGLREHVLNRVDLEDNIVYGSGPGYRVVVPGEGVVLLNTGHWTYNQETGEFHHSGPGQVAEQNAPLLCTLLRQ